MTLTEIVALIGVEPGHLRSQQSFGNYRAAETLIEAAGLSSGTGMRGRYNSESFVEWFNIHRYEPISRVPRIDGTPALAAMGLDDLDDEPTPSRPVAPALPLSGSSEADDLARLIRNLASGAMDEDKVRKIASDEAAYYAELAEENAIRRVAIQIEDAIAGFKPTVTTVELVSQNPLEPIALGIQHCQFPTLVKMVHAKGPDGHRLNIWLTGPAGSGKTRAAEECAKALGLDFRFCGALDSQYGLSGFVDAGGRTVRTPFREAYEHGGMFLFDEVDASDPSAVLFLNAALANGHCAFPDCVIVRHADCCIIAAANTWGHGGTGDYVGRVKQDAAFLSRFVHLPWEYDPALEIAISGNVEWASYVQAVRQRVQSRGIKVVISPRASIYGASLLAAGLDRETVANATLRQGMTQSDWESVR